MSKNGMSQCLLNRLKIVGENRKLAKTPDIDLTSYLR